MQYEYHPLANLFPLMEAPEFESFVENMRQKGQRDPIETFKGYIIDGRNRERACIAAGIKPQYKEWEGDEKGLLDYILSKNLHRRQLNESQKAMVGARLKPLFEQEAKKRQGIRTDISANLRGSENRKSSEDIARVVNVSSRSVETAIKVLAKGLPELVGHVESGAIRLGQASKIADMPSDKQLILLSLPKTERTQEIKRLKPNEQDKQEPTKTKETAAPGVIGASKASLLTVDGLSDMPDGEACECGRPTLPEPMERVDGPEPTQIENPCVVPKMIPAEKFDNLSKTLIEIVEGAEADGWVSLPISSVSDLVKKLMPFVERATEGSSSSEGLDAQPAVVESSFAHPPLAQEHEVSIGESQEAGSSEALKMAEVDFRKRKCAKRTKASSPDSPEAQADEAEEAPGAKSKKRPACFGDGGHPNGRCNGCKDVNECMKAYFAKMREEKQAA